MDGSMGCRGVKKYVTNIGDPVGLRHQYERIRDTARNLSLMKDGNSHSCRVYLQDHRFCWEINQVAR